jgi:hypothetical protein
MKIEKFTGDWGTSTSLLNVSFAPPDETSTRLAKPINLFSAVTKAANTPTLYRRALFVIISSVPKPLDLVLLMV